MIHCYARVIADNKFNTLLLEPCIPGMRAYRLRQVNLQNIPNSILKCLCLTIFRSALAVIMPLICRAELPRELYNHDNAIPYIHQWTKELQRLLRWYLGLFQLGSFLINPFMEVKSVDERPGNHTNRFGAKSPFLQISPQ